MDCGRYFRILNHHYHHNNRFFLLFLYHELLFHKSLMLQLNIFDKRYIGETHSNICQPAIINNTTETFPDTEIPTIIPDTGPKLTKTDGEMTYLKKKNIDEYIHQKLMKKDVFKTCTVSTILLWVRQIINYRRRQNRIPPNRWSSQA